MKGKNKELINERKKEDNKKLNKYRQRKKRKKDIMNKNIINNFNRSINNNE